VQKIGTEARAWPGYEISDLGTISCPGRQEQGVLHAERMETPISGLPEIGNQMRAGAGCGTRAHRQHDLAGLGLIAHRQSLIAKR
jgi:hypothetical protein